MALALILEISHQPDSVRVRFDIGHNRFVRWQLGGEDKVTRNGLPSLASIKKRSDVVGPIRQDARGRGELDIPRTLIDHDNHYIQLVSYRDEEGNGPALSGIHSIPVTSVVRKVEELPPPVGMSVLEAVQMEMDSAITDFKKDTAMNAVSFSYFQQVDNAPFHLRERPLSQPMFLEAIVGALPTILPMLAPAIGSLVSGVAPAVGQVAGQLLRNVSGGGGAQSAPVGTPAATPSAPATPVQRTTGGTNSQTAITQIANLAEQAIRALGPASQQVLTPENLRQITELIRTAATPAAAAPAPAASQTPPATSQAQSRYSQAQVAPALLAALPALMPLLRQVLSPQTVQSVIQAPERMTGQIINGITDFARLGLQADQQLNEHLRALNPGVHDPELHQLLAGLSLGMASRRGRQYKRVSSVTLQLDDVQTQVVMGRELALYQQGSALQFPLSVQTPKTITDAELMLQVKQADNLRTVHEEGEEIGDISSGPIEIIPMIDADVTKKLAPQKDYIVVLTLLWRNSKGRLRGTSVQQTISLMGEYRFDRVEESGELLSLGDREVYSDYWHEIWETAFDRDTRRVDIKTRYYLTLRPERNTNARLDSELYRKSERRRETIQLRSGYEFSLFALNHLMSRLVPDQPPLEEAALAALAGDDFIERFNQAAQHQGKFRGRPGDTASLWVYPVFKLQTLVLVRSKNVDSNGNIGQLVEERIKFPMPAMMHFIGVQQS